MPHLPHIEHWRPDAAFRKLVADYEKASGNKIDYSIIPFVPLRQKFISAITSGDRAAPREGAGARISSFETSAIAMVYRLGGYTTIRVAD